MREKKWFLLVMLAIFLSVFPLNMKTPVATAAPAASEKWVQENGKTKYLLANGQYQKGWKKINGRIFYFNKQGVMLTGLKKLGKKYFYFAKKGSVGARGRMITGWLKLGGKQYYFRKSGTYGVRGSAFTSEWVTLKNTRYYFNYDGSLTTKPMMTEQEFVDMIGPLARQDMKKTGILASVTTAQAILESGYGTTSLGMEANNLFGMKATLSGNTWPSQWKGKIFTKNTMEYLNKKWITISDDFRAYDSIAESIADHSAYLANAMNGSKLRYKGVVGNKNYKKTIKLIKNGGYATDPEYVSKICSIIKRFKLTKYDK